LPHHGRTLAEKTWPQAPLHTNFGALFSFAAQYAHGNLSEAFSDPHLFLVRPPLLLSISRSDAATHSYMFHRFALTEEDV
jgi:hypothetical protein